jgi:hypothetical protein
MAVTYGRYKFLTVSLPKRLHNGRFTSETAVRRFQKLNRNLDPEVIKKKSVETSRKLSIYNSFSRRRRWAWL